MIKRLTNLLGAFLICGILSAQSDFRKGYIVKLNGDTLSGYVNYQKDAVNATVCNFKRFDIAAPVTYTADKLRAYGFKNGKQYMSVQWNGNRYFAEYLVKGEVNLLYLNKSGDHFFMYSGNNMQELKSGKMADSSTGKTYPNYKEYLTEKFQSVIPEDIIKHSKLEIPSLTGVFQLYNEKSGYAFLVPERPRGKSLIKDYNLLGTNKLHIGILGGMSMYNYSASIKKNVSFYLLTTEFNQELNPTGGVFVKWNFWRTRPQFSLQSNILYQQVSLYGFSKVPYYLNKDILQYHDVFMDFKELKFQAILNYSLLKSNFDIVPHVGVGYCSRIDPVYFHLYEEFNTTTNVVKASEFQDIGISGGESVLIGGVTFQYKFSPARSIFISADMEYGANLTKNLGNTYLESIKLKGSAMVMNFTIGLSL